MSYWDEQLEQILLDSQGDFLKATLSNIEIRAKAAKTLTALKDAEVERVIGEDEIRPTSWSNKVGLESEWERRQVRNHFRAEQRLRAKDAKEDSV